MPIFEYKCSNCNKKFEVLHKSVYNSEKIECPECQSINVKKLISAFSTSGISESQRYSVADQNCETGTCGCSSDFCGVN